MQISLRATHAVANNLLRGNFDSLPGGHVIRAIDEDSVSEPQRPAERPRPPEQLLFAPNGGAFGRQGGHT